MNRTFSRLLALAGSAAVGLTGAIAFGAPAQAHHTTITATPECVEHEWVITWTVQNSESKIGAEFTEVNSTPTTITTIAVDAALPKGGSISGVQKVPADATSATLSISVLWSNYNTFDDSKTIQLNPRECVNPTPTPSPPASASPSPSASETVPASPVPSPSVPGLPVTGTQVTSIVVAGLVLLVGGAAIFLITRRRRLNLTDLE